MKRLIPNELLNILECWLSRCYSSVKWYDAWSYLFIVNFGVRQGSVLSPFLFAIYLDDVTRSPLLTRSMFIVLYADDILSIAPSVCMLDKLLKICEHELDLLDMAINVKKSCCLRIGPRNNFSCSPISMSKGTVLPWVSERRYLGIYIKQSTNFRCSVDHAKRSFYWSANAIFVKLGESPLQWRHYSTVNKYQMYSCFTIWFRSLSATRIRSVIPRFCNKSIIYEII